MTIIKDVKIINHNNIIDNADITIEDNKIIEINEKSGKAKFKAVPGFIDIHLHWWQLNNGFPKEHQTKEYFENILKGLYKIGTHGAFFTTLAWPLKDIKNCVTAYVKFIKNFKQDADSAKFYGIHLEGPFISRKYAGMQNPNNILSLDGKVIDELEEIFKLGEGHIKMITYAPENDNAQLLEFLCKKYGIKLSIGHSVATSKETRNYFKRGVQLATHLWNAMSGIDHHSPGGIVSEVLTNDDIFVELIARSHRDDINKITWRCKGADKIILVTDWGNLEMGDGDYYTNGLNIYVKNKQCFLKENDKPIEIYDSNRKIETMLENWKVANDILNATDQEKVKMTSYNAAKLFNLNIGDIAVGKESNILILDNEDKIVKKYI